MGRIHPQAKEHRGSPAIARSYDEARKNYSLEPWRGMWLFCHLDFWLQNLGLQTLERTNFCCFKPPSLVLYRDSRRRLTQVLWSQTPSRTSGSEPLSLDLSKPLASDPTVCFGYEFPQKSQNSVYILLPTISGSTFIFASQVSVLGVRCTTSNAPLPLATAATTKPVQTLAIFALMHPEAPHLRPAPYLPSLPARASVTPTVDTLCWRVHTFGACLAKEQWSPWRSAFPTLPQEDSSQVRLIMLSSRF